MLFVAIQPEMLAVAAGNLLGITDDLSALTAKRFGAYAVMCQPVRAESYAATNVANFVEIN